MASAGKYHDVRCWSLLPFQILFEKYFLIWNEVPEWLVVIVILHTS